MPNPFKTGSSTPGKLNNPGYGVNDDHPTTTRYKTPFRWSYPVQQTARFAEVKPCFVMEAVPNDDIRVYRSSSENSFTLQAPLLSPIKKHYEYFAVPKQAILHNTWSKIFVNPKKGDDIVPEDVNCVINPREFYNALRGVALTGLTADSTDMDIISAFRLALLICDVFGPDSLMLKTGSSPLSAVSNRTYIYNDGSYPYWNIVTVSSTPGPETLQKSFFKVFSEVTSLGCQFSLGSNSVRYAYDLSKPTGLVSFQSFCDLMRNLDFDTDSFTFIRTVPQADMLSSFVDAIKNFFGQLQINSPYFYLNTINDLLNIQPVVAYQLACSQFITNDNVDDIYTSELYRQNQESLVCETLGSLPTFEWNGIITLYDWCSGEVMSQMYGAIDDNPITSAPTQAAINFFCNLFFTRNSLRFGDMFNSCRTDPAAVGDTDIPVQSSQVNTIAVVQNILKEKFLNLVNNVRNTVREYSLSVFGVAPDILPEEPRKISSSSMDVDTSLNVNTANDQGKQMVNLTGLSQNAEFTAHFNQDTIIIGVSWYEILPSYNLVRSPFAYHIDRFDSFLPQLQNIGNVSVGRELFVVPSSYPSVYGYLPNDYEYKQDFGKAFGAFLIAGQLPGWNYSRLMNGLDSILSPYSIRHQNYEFDGFYAKLPGVLSEYFHFIENDVFTVEASRPMEYVPGILMNS